MTTAADQTVPETHQFTIAALRARIDTAPQREWTEWIGMLREDTRAGARALADRLERRAEKRHRAEQRAEALWTYESAWHTRGAFRVAGVDEAGRGPLAGPIVAAAVVFANQPDLSALDDSKRLTREQRETLFPAILSTAEDWGIGVVDSGDIDRMNIQRANYLAMRLALADLQSPADAVLVDGFALPEMPVPSERVIKGDQRSWSIAAASVLAKVTRDRMMRTYDARYPQYGFALHKGYGTSTHLEALMQHGPSPIHRRSFAPVAAAARRHGEAA